MYVNDNNVTYFGSFGAERIPKETKKFIGNKNITTNINRIQAYGSIMCLYFCIGFIDFILKDKNLVVYTNLFSPNGYENSIKIFSIIKRMKKIILRNL